MEMGMSKFVKLTGHASREIVLIDASRVAAIEWQPAERDYGDDDIGRACVFFDSGFEIYVTETPEQILALIEGPSGEYEPLCSDDEPF